jgi:hypothetical protein
MTEETQAAEIAEESTVGTDAEVVVNEDPGYVEEMEGPIPDPVTEAPSPEVAAAQIQAKQVEEQQELQFRAEIKHFSIMLLAGIKANNSRSHNGKKDVDYVKEAVRNAMLTVNYVNQLPLNFQQPQAAPQPAPLKMVNKEEAATTEE